MNKTGVKKRDRLLIRKSAALRASGKERPFTEARAVASLLVQERSHLSLTELGRELNRDISPLGRVGRRLLKEATRDERLRELVEKVRGELPE